MFLLFHWLFPLCSFLFFLVKLYYFSQSSYIIQWFIHFNFSQNYRILIYYLDLLFSSSTFIFISFLVLSFGLLCCFQFLFFILEVNVFTFILSFLLINKFSAMNFSLMTKCIPQNLICRAFIVIISLKIYVRVSRSCLIRGFKISR